MSMKIKSWLNKTNTKIIQYIIILYKIALLKSNGKFAISFVYALSDFDNFFYI